MNNAWKEAFVAEMRSTFHEDNFPDIMARYDSIANDLGAETSYLACMAEMTNQPLQTIQKKAKSIKQEIFETLEQANKTHIGVGHAAQLERVKRAAKKWNATIEAVTKNVAIRVGNRVLKIDESEYDAAKYNMPAVLREQRYEAQASTNKNGVKGELACRITTFNGR